MNPWSSLFVGNHGNNALGAGPRAAPRQDFVAGLYFKAIDHDKSRLVERVQVASYGLAARMAYAFVPLNDHAHYQASFSGRGHGLAG